MTLVTALVTGSRYWTDRDVIERALAAEETAAGWLHPGPYRFTLVHGACPARMHHGQVASADHLAGSVARSRGWEVQPYPAPWGQHGLAAGRLRNQTMVDVVAYRPGERVCIGFPLPDSRGTVDCLARARAAGIRTWTAAPGMGAEPEGGE